METIIGKKYQNLTIVKELQNDEVECECICGNLVKTDINSLKSNRISMCENCKNKQIKQENNAGLLLDNRYKKELYYIWTSYKNLYNNSSPPFDKNIRFFPSLSELDEEDAFKRFYQWATIGCEQKYGENGKVCLIRVDETKDYSFDNCLWIYQDLDKYKYVKLGNCNIDLFKDENIYGVSQKKQESYYCFDCLYKQINILNKTEQEKINIINRNTEIYRKIICDGQLKQTLGYKPYYYNGNSYHKECLLHYLRKTIKDEQQVQKEYQKVIEEHSKDNRPAGKLKQDDIINVESKNNLIQYLMGKYSINQLPKKAQYTIDNLNKGTSKNFGNVVISYEKLLDMFLYYEDDLFELYKKNLKKGKAPSNATQRIIYDLAVVVYNLDEYDSRKQSKFSQQDEREEIIDVTKYIRRDKKKEEEIERERRESIRKAREFADEMTKEYDEEDNSYIASLFKDD